MVNIFFQSVNLIILIYQFNSNGGTLHRVRHVGLACLAPQQHLSIGILLCISFDNGRRVAVTNESGWVSENIGIGTNNDNKYNTDATRASIDLNVPTYSQGG